MDVALKSSDSNLMFSHQVAGECRHNIWAKDKGQ